MKKGICIDCGGETSTVNVKRCRKCYLKFNVGENSSNYV